MKPPAARQDLLQTLVPFPFNELKDPLTDLAFYDVMKPLLAFCTGIAHASSLALRTKAAHTAQVADALECLREQLEAAGAILKRWGGPGPSIHTRPGLNATSGEEQHG